MSEVPPGRPSRLLVVVADDFGIGVETSRGIIDAARDGPVTGTSALVVAEACEASLPLLDGAPDLELGLHVALTGGFRPIQATRASGLVGRDGRFGSLATLCAACLTGRVSRAALRDEIAAQAERLRRLADRPPVYFDGHHHAHELPVIRDVVAELAQAGVLPAVTRVTPEPEGIRRRLTGDRLRRRILDALGRRAASHFARYALRTNDTLFGTFVDPARAVTGGFPWAAHLSHLPEAGVVEWMVHPGRPDPTLRGIDPYIEGRVAEWRALTAPEHRAAWAGLPWPRVGKASLRVGEGGGPSSRPGTGPVPSGGAAPDRRIG
jgi:predicted glycoside hydrolase/deacetylase ChbG (UPF0249 family)